MKENKKEISISAAILIFFVLAFAFSGKDRSAIPEGIVMISGDEDTHFDIDIETQDYLIEDYELMIKKPDISEAKFEETINKYKNDFIKKMIGNSEGVEKVVESLNFFDKYEDLPFDFIWYVNDKMYISDSGEILCAEAFDTTIELIISYKSFDYDLSIPIHVDPCETEISRIKKESLKSNVVDAIDTRIDAMMNSENQEFIELPKDVNGEKVRYYKSGKERNYLYLIMGPITVSAMHVAFLNDKRKEKEKEMDELMAEYPVMLQKIALYVSSGMTIRNVWAKICFEAKESGQDMHPLYREMQVTLNEINNGISEGVAYIRFGERIKKSEIVRFTALLAQNLKRGSTKLSELLDNEVQNAFVDKKNRARKQGEKIGTKLLVPMMILLTDTIVIIIVPAFWSI